MNEKEFYQAKVEIHDSAGPCTSALNDYYLKGKGAPFFDYTFFQIDGFYLKYTQRISSDQLWAHVDGPITRVFDDADMELANNCLFRFQTVCDQEKISTRNPISFFKSLDSKRKAGTLFFDTVAPLFLYATTDRGFLFDSALQSSLPSIMITRAFIDQLKASDNNILLSPVFSKPKWEPHNRYWEMQEQVRNFHLMLPNRITFCDRWLNVTLPLVKKMQEKNKRYHEDLDLDYSVDNTIQQQLAAAVMDCFVWYMSSRKHLGVELNSEIDRKISYLQRQRESPDNNVFKESMTKIVNALLDEKCDDDFPVFAHGFPFFVYRLFTKFYSKLENGDVPDVKKVIGEMRLSVNTEIKSNETTSAQWNRWNLLLFKQICHKTAPYLPKGAVERSVYILEFSEKIMMECYIDDALLDLEVTDDRIKNYILKGENAGAAVLPELKEHVEYAEKNLEILPFDVLNYKAWNETPQTLQDFMDSSKRGKGSGRGRKKTKRNLLSELLTKLDDYEYLKGSYFHLVFEDNSGYGSGLPTYDWAFRLAHLIDQIISKPSVQNALHEELTSQPELVELSIHQYFLSEFAQEIKELIAVWGKVFLYHNFVQKLPIQQP